MFSDGSVGRSAFVAASARLTETTIGARVSVYRNAVVRNSIIGDDCWVGDDAALADVQLCGNNSINRRNVVLRSRIGRYSYTGNNTTIRSSDVGRFCSISWNVSVGGGDHEMAALTTMTRERFSFLDNIVEAAELRAESLQRLARLSCCRIGNDVWIGTGATAMRRSLDLQGGLFMSEAAMMGLAPHVGKARSHLLVYAATGSAMDKGLSLREALLGDAEVMGHLDEAGLDAMLDPAIYIGSAGQMVDGELGRPATSRKWSIDGRTGRSIFS